MLNDSIAENECVADFTTSHDELEKIMLVNGTEPRCGVINHYGWYEDAGYKGMKELTGRWQHIYICFDGRMEQVYINGELLADEHYGKEVMLDPGIAAESITLGDDEYFVLGDNRNHSSDSRDPSVGVLHRKDLIGRAWVRIWPFSDIGFIRHD